MKKNIIFLLLCLTAAAFGFADQLPPTVYINGQTPLPAGNVQLDANGACWVNANYIPLSPDEQSRLSGSSLNYQEYVGGVNYYNINALASFLNWTLIANGGNITLTTFAYPAAPASGSGQPAATNNVNSGSDGGQPQTESVVNDITTDSSTPEDSININADLPPLYYMGGDFGPGYYGGGGVEQNNYYDNHNNDNDNNNNHDHWNNNNENNRPYYDRNNHLVYQGDPGHSGFDDSGSHFDNAKPDFGGGGFRGGGGFHGRR